MTSFFFTGCWIFCEAFKITIWHVGLQFYFPCSTHFPCLQKLIIKIDFSKWKSELTIVLYKNIIEVPFTLKNIAKEENSKNKVLFLLCFPDVLKINKVTLWYDVSSPHEVSTNIETIFLFLFLLWNHTEIKFRIF